jgi:hypothetical protein
MPLPGAGEIIEILPASTQEPQVFDALDRATDECIHAAHGGSYFQG